MAKLPLDQAIPRFQSNEERLDTFANGSETQSYIASTGSIVPSIQKFLARKDQEINTGASSVLALTTNQANAASLSAAQAAASAASLDAGNLATLSGNQTITGVKTFTNPIIGSTQFQQSGTGAVVRTSQDKMLDAPQSIADFGTVDQAFSSGGLFTKDEAATGEEWYWGRKMSGTKAPGTGPRNLAMGPGAFMFDIREDSADCGGDFMRSLHGRTVYGGGTTRGGRIAVLGEALHNLGATNAANTNRNYVGIVGIAHSEVGDGGTDALSGAKGAYFGLNGIGRAAAGATNIFEVAGCELNVYAGAGSSIRYLFGATISGFKQVYGEECDAALEIGGGTDAGFGPHIGWKNGILFTNIHGANPLATDAKLISAYFSGEGMLRTIAAGLDTSLFNCTSGIVLGPNLVVTDNELKLGANNANISKIQAGNNVSAANLDLCPKGGGGIRLFDGESGTVRLLVDPGIGIRMIPLASATPVNNGEVAIQATSNTSLTFKFKGSDGVVRSGSLTLA